MFGIWVFDIPPSPTHSPLLTAPLLLFELLARYSDCGTLYVCSCCRASTGPEVFSKPAAVTTQICCQEPVLEQWPGTPQILASQERGSEQERWRERRGWRGSDGELGDIMSIYAETHVQDLLTFFGQQNPGQALWCAKSSRQLP